MRDDNSEFIGSGGSDEFVEPIDDDANEGAEGAPSFGAEWGALLRTFADMEDALGRLHRSLDEMRAPCRPLWPRT